MYNYDKYQMKDKDFEKVISNQISNKRRIVVVRNGSRKSIFHVGGKKSKTGELQNDLMACNLLEKDEDFTGGITGKEFISFLRVFKKNLHKSMLNNQDLLKLKVLYEGNSRNRNESFWNSIKIGDYFGNIDIDSAYWQIGNKLTYVNNKLFNKYFENQDYKVAKRLCFSFLGREVAGEYPEEYYREEITCDTQCYQNVYDNVRNQLYIHIQSIIKLLGENYIEYNIDAVSVLPDKIDVVKNYLRSNGIASKMTLCRKISNEQYYHGIKIKNF